MRQYHGIKTRYRTRWFCFAGRFYELFYEDAIAASRELQITLTSRNRERGEPSHVRSSLPRCRGYIARLLRAGYKIAVAIR